MNAGDLNALIAEGRERAEALEEKLAAAYASAIGRAGDRAARAFARKVTDPDAVVASARWQPPQLAEVLDEAALADSARKKTKATQRSMLEAQVGSSLADAGISWTVRHPLSQDLLDGLAARADDIADGLREPISRAIATGHVTGKSVPDTARLIRESVHGVKGWQATMLARNDLIGVSNGGGLMQARMLKAADPKSAGFKTWLSAGDGLVRRSHAAASGQTVKLDQPFNVGSSLMQYPGDPGGAHADVVNCRCVQLFTDGPTLKDEDRVVPERTAAQSSVQKGETAQRILGHFDDLKQLHSDGAGSYLPSRAPLHEQAIGSVLKGATAGQKKPRSVMFAGGSGSGKGQVRGAMSGLPKRAAVIDPDAIMDYLPEYREMVAAGERYAAKAGHSEASDLAKQALFEANEQRSHVIIDGTGNKGPGRFAAKIKRQQDLGNDVEVVLVDARIDVAMERVNSRAAETGRLVPVEVVQEIHGNVTSGFRQWRELTDWKVFANDVNGEPARLIAQRKRGVETVYDEARLREMLDKATW